MLLPFLDKNMTTLPKYTNYYYELISPLKKKCMIRIISNEDKNYLNEISGGNVDEIYFSNDLFKHKLKNFIDIELTPGKCIIIPSKWIYSIKSDEDNIIFYQTWNNYINKISHLYEYFKK